MPRQPDNKSETRNSILRRLDDMPYEVRRQKDAEIERRLLSLPEIKCAKSVMLYASVRCEVGTQNLISHCLSRGTKTGLPRVMTKERHLRIFEIRHMGELTPGCWGIPEPVESDEREMSLEEIDIVIIPCVAFDTSLNRLGHGKGYYDRLLGSVRKIDAAGRRLARPFLAGLAYEEQTVPSLYCGPYDIKMDAVITDKRMLTGNG
jgi:5-formyltetrahydrofolate cyclo-ligase